MKIYICESHVAAHQNLLFTLAILIVLASNVNAQGDVTISGFVNDKITGEALIGTNILLYKDTLSLKDPPLKGASTNSYGFYAIPNVLKGSYILVARNIGYKTLILNVEVVISKGTLNLNLEMMKEEIELEEIIVTGKKEEKARISTINISPELLKKLPSMSGEANIIKSLQLLPGVMAASELSKGLYVRGGSPDQTLTLIDGMVIYNPAHLGNFTSTFNSSGVQDVKLIKGAIPAEYGGRMSSVLDIKLRSGTKEKDKGSISLGFINSSLNLEGPLSDNSTYMISGRGMYYDAIQNNFTDNSTLPRYNYYDINTKFTYTISDRNIISISGFLSRDNLYSPANSEDILYNVDWQNGAVNLNWLQAGDNSFFTNTTFSYISYQFESNYNSGLTSESSSDYFSFSEITDFILKKNFEFHWLEDNILKAGVKLAAHNYDLIASNFYDPALEVNSSANTEIFATEVSIYLQNESQMFSRLKTNIGGRFHYYELSKYLSFEPRISFSLAVTDNFFVKGGVSLSHQFLHLITRNDITLPTELWYPSTKNIKPSKSTAYVFGFNQYFSNQEYLFSIEGYYRDMKNLYEFKADAAFNIFEPIENLFTSGEGEAYGLEFFLSKRAGTLSGWIGYTLSWTKRLFRELNAGRVYYPRYDRRHDISVVLAYDFTKSLTAGLTFVYATGQAFTLPSGKYQFNNIIDGASQIYVNYPERNGVRLPDYHKLDLNITYRFNWFNLLFEAYLNFYNIYNRQNAFAQYATEVSTSGEDKIIKLKQITLFPFIPTAGIRFEF